MRNTEMRTDQRDTEMRKGQRDTEMWKGQALSSGMTGEDKYEYYGA